MNPRGTSSYSIGTTNRFGWAMLDVETQTRDETAPELTAPKTRPRPGAEIQKLSVLMPVYNEMNTLRTITGRVLEISLDLELELVCVDDGSTDRSWSVLEELAQEDRRLRIIRHESNRGKGAAIRTAIEHMTGDVALIQDADLEYDPGDYPLLLRPILNGQADAVFGSRFLSGGQRRILHYWHAVANRNAPTRLIRTDSSNTSGIASFRPPGRLAPALLTRMSSAGRDSASSSIALRSVNWSGR